MLKKNINSEIAKFAKNFFAPLIGASENPDALEILFAQIGIDFSYLSKEDIEDIQSTLSPITLIFDKELSKFDEILLFLKKIDGALTSLSKVKEIIKKIINNDSIEIDDVLSGFITHLALRNLYYNYTTTFNILSLIDVVKYVGNNEVITNSKGQIIRIPQPKFSIDFAQITRFLFSPISTLKEIYLPSGGVNTAEDAKNISDKLFPQIGLILSAYKVDFNYGLIDEDKEGFSDNAFNTMRRTLYLAFPEIYPNQKINLSLLIIPKNEGGPAIKLIADGSIDFSFSTDNWIFLTKGSGNLPTLIIGVDGLKLIKTNYEDCEFIFSSEYLNSEQQPAFYLGESTGTKIEIQNIESNLFLSTKKSNFGIEFLLKNCSITISGGNSDGFISKLLPQEGIKVEFDLGISWSYIHGIALNGSVGLESEFRIDKNILDIINLKSIKTSLLGDSNTLSASLGIVLDAHLGPITASINNIGLSAGFEYQNKVFFFGFKPPTGVGLSISSSGITGAGNLDFDQANQRYTGGLGLQFGNIGLAAIGLIVTKSDNYSLLINIGAIFTPGIQLGFGFYLSGVGGLIAVNRSMSIKALQEGIRDGAVSNLLFPDITTVVANADQLISQMERIFPVQEGRYVIGPMIRVGWGPMNMLNAEVGIFIEVPSPVRVVLLGQVNLAFPRPEEAILVIHLDILGVIDFDKSELTFQASLFESRILEFPITGDSAFLVGWGNSPRFVLSMGGFHPKYSPPPPAVVFADMKRLKISLGSGNGLDISCESYLALTSNSLQFGANVQVIAKAGSLAVQGYLGFDGLFIFHPFSFEVEIRGGVHLTYKGYSLCGVSLRLLLSGPNPWYARGTATIDILFFSIGVGFKFTWGDEDKEELPALDPLAYLLQELAQPENWGVTQSNRYQLVESFREADPLSPDVPGLLLHPASQLELRQRVVPLNKTITKFGYAPVTGHDWFDIAGFTIFTIGETKFDKDGDTEKIEDYFAEAQFNEVTKDQQLSLPAFKEEKSGLKLKADQTILVSQAHTTKPVEYEMIVLDEYGLTEAKTTQKVGWATKTDYLVKNHSDIRQGSRRAPVDRFKGKSVTPLLKRVKPDESYVVVKKDAKGKWAGPVSMSAIQQTYQCLSEQLRNRKEITYTREECLEMLQDISRSTFRRIDNLRVIQTNTWKKIKTH